MTSTANTDTLAASIEGPDGTSQPARLTEGEFVFSLPAIIALGEGDYDSGIAILEPLHEELRVKGEEFLSGKGLGAAVSPEGM